MVAIRSKADLNRRPAPDGGAFPPAISVRSGEGLDALLAALGRAAAAAADGDPLVSHVRQKRCLADAAEALELAARADLPPEVLADALRRASDALGRLTGRVDVEAVLGRIFSSFCIGK